MFLTLKYYSLFSLISKLLMGQIRCYSALILEFLSGALFVGVKQVTSLCGTALFSIPTTLQSSSDLFSKNLLSSFHVLPPVFCEAVMHSVMGISIGQVQMHLKARLAVMCLHSLCALFALCHNGVRSACFNSISVVKLLAAAASEGKPQKIIGKKMFWGYTNQGDFDVNLNPQD